MTGSKLNQELFTRHLLACSWYLSGGSVLLLFLFFLLLLVLGPLTYYDLMLFLCSSLGVLANLLLLRGKDALLVLRLLLNICIS